MKKFLLILVIALTTQQVYGYGHRKFDPKKFEVELEQFIVTEAALTPQEASEFFPIYKEMQRKQRMLYNKGRRYRHIDMEDEKSSLEAIKNRDEIEVQIKKLQQQYHIKFCKILPAKKVLRIIRAEEKFHRQAFRRATGRK